MEVGECAVDLPGLHPSEARVVYLTFVEIPLLNRCTSQGSCSSERTCYMSFPLSLPPPSLSFFHSVPSSLCFSHSVSLSQTRSPPAASLSVPLPAPPSLSLSLSGSFMKSSLQTRARFIS